MSKYLIRNCPAISFAGGCQNKEVKVWDCQDCTDCVLKKIVEKCKEVQELEYQKGRLKCKSPSKAKFGREILKLLDIQEVE